MEIIYLDTETTHADEDARLIQLAYKTSSSGEEINEFFKPPIPISFGAMAVHHVTNEMIADKPIFEKSESQKKIANLLTKNILVAHNAKFDIMILENEGVGTGKFIDTLRVARHILDSEKYNLQYLRYSLGLNVEGKAHDAFGDILVLESLFSHLSKVIKEKFSLDSEEEINNKMLELTELPVLLDNINFGKHKGKTFKEVSLIDGGYLMWLFNSESQKSETEQNEDLVYTLKNYINN